MKPSIKTLTIVIGTLLGAFLGYNIASTLVKQAEATGRKTPINAQQGFKLGMTAWGFLRDIAKIGR
jgi:hypothetical protein